MNFLANPILFLFNLPERKLRRKLFFKIPLEQVLAVFIFLFYEADKAYTSARVALLKIFLFELIVALNSSTKISSLKEFELVTQGRGSL